jgi:hypothetical protein
MMFCPQCLTEYREGFTTCADCHVPLQSGVPAKPKPEAEAFPALVGVLDTSDGFALGMATAALREADIIYDVVPVLWLENPLKSVTWKIGPSRILVSLDDENEARALVEPFQQPMAGEISK